METHSFKNPVQVRISCVECGRTFELTVESDDLRAWNRRDRHIQDCFPYLTPAQRELFLSRLCGDCFEALFKEE